MSERKHTFHNLVFIETELYGDVYSKNDVDNVIAKRDKVIEKQDKEIVRHKRKRCLALAKWCKLEQERIELIKNQDITDDDFDKLVKGFYTKWQNRWLAIADKFKEA